MRPHPHSHSYIVPPASCSHAGPANNTALRVTGFKAAAEAAVAADLCLLWRG